VGKRSGNDVDPDLSAEEVVDHRRAAAMRHVNHVDADLRLERFARHVRDRASAVRGQRDLAGIGLGERDQVGDAFRRDGGMGFDHQRKQDDAGDRRDISEKIK
jgi:hypothetical protein